MTVETETEKAQHLLNVCSSQAETNYFTGIISFAQNLCVEISLRKNIPRLLQAHFHLEELAWRI